MDISSCLLLVIWFCHAHSFRLASAATDHPPNLIEKETGLQGLGAQHDLQAFFKDLESVPQLADIVAKGSNITILAPVNAAWHRVDENQRTNIAFLALHILEGKILSTNIPVVQYEQGTGIITPTFLNGTAMYTSLGQPASLVHGTQSLKAIALGSREELLWYSGKGTSRVTQADIIYGDLVVHKMNSALELPTSSYEVASHVGLWGYKYTVFMAGLDVVISEIPNATLLLPTNEAFEAALPFYWDASTENFRRLVLRHVIPGHVVWSDQFVNASYQTAEGSEIRFSINGEHKIFVDNAVILWGSDIPLYNGVAHVLSRVLL